MDVELLEQSLRESGQPAFRARQVWEWAARGSAGFEEMTNLPKALRESLAREVPFSTLTVVEEQRAKDGTQKTLFRTHDGHPVEAVLMRYKDGRRSVCVSSQSGCPLTCTFCATGRMAFGRNLTPWEILDQVLHFRRAEALDHLVFMGMGEPFMNVDNVLAAARRLPDLGITPRRTTISTVGWVPGLTRFVEEVTEPIRLALSLHAADPRLALSDDPGLIHRGRDYLAQRVFPSLTRVSPLGRNPRLHTSGCKLQEVGAGGPFLCTMRRRRWPA